MRKATFTRVVSAVMLTAGTLLTTVTVARARLTAEQQCQKSRYAAAGKYAQCHANAMAQLFASNNLTKLQPALSKCRVKYTGTYVKLQKKAVGTGSTCDAPRFIDNGDTTVTDNLTGLQWNQKDENGGINDKDTTFTWINANTFYRNTSYISPFDWRSPTVAELQTILSEPFPCTTSPCIAAVFGPTAAADYWSSTTLADNPDYAWGVFFGNGEVSYGIKTLNNSLRVVRGGL
jgi:hypothetical protein